MSSPYYRRGNTCQSCGAEPHWEEGADKDWLAINAPLRLDGESEGDAWQEWYLKVKA
jgi:hypothetical protein